MSANSEDLELLSVDDVDTIDNPWLTHLVWLVKDNTFVKVLSEATLDLLCTVGRVLHPLLSQVLHSSIPQ